ncbi:hypothetical protein BN2476_1640019 [Paraburkholderia piptadeniae]|uniref:Uncharacterized protein n=1 Tax=Paraburkholderia piptadeniae TaxID=1701573 RepID=A0A1N7SYH9_9BURK|nr:hypothetical protein BN2476_1640019 [Paraburkholderia piptadeniae]
MTDLSKNSQVVAHDYRQSGHCCQRVVAANPKPLGDLAGHGRTPRHQPHKPVNFVAQADTELYGAGNWTDGVRAEGSGCLRGFALTSAPLSTSTSRSPGTIAVGGGYAPPRRS